MTSASSSSSSSSGIDAALLGGGGSKTSDVSNAQKIDMSLLRPPPVEYCKECGKEFESTKSLKSHKTKSIKNPSMCIPNADRVLKVTRLVSCWEQATKQGASFAALSESEAKRDKKDSKHSFSKESDPDPSKSEELEDETPKEKPRRTPKGSRSPRRRRSKTPAKKKQEISESDENGGDESEEEGDDDEDEAEERDRLEEREGKTSEKSKINSKKMNDRTISLLNWHDKSEKGELQETRRNKKGKVKETRERELRHRQEMQSALLAQQRQLIELEKRLTSAGRHQREDPDSDSSSDSSESAPAHTPHHRSRTHSHHDIFLRVRAMCAREGYRRTFMDWDVENPRDRRELAAIAAICSAVEDGDLEEVGRLVGARALAIFFRNQRDAKSAFYEKIAEGADEDEVGEFSWDKRAAKYAASREKGFELSNKYYKRMKEEREREQERRAKKEWWRKKKDDDSKADPSRSSGGKPGEARK